MKENIKRYEQDIKHLEREKITCRYKDLARFSASVGGIRLIASSCYNKWEVADKMILSCENCNKIISINNGFCPFCGNTRILTQGPLTFEFIMLNNLTVTNKNTGKKKYKYVVKQSKSGFTHSFKLNRPVLRISEIDRRNNRYFEEVIDCQKDKTIHFCDEPLDKHIGHGSAKFKKK